jgi:phospholipase C
MVESLSQLGAEDSHMPTGPINHVVVLMLENHCFDQMLGWLKQDLYPNLEGVDPAHLATNKDKDGNPYTQAPTTAPVVSPDPGHDTTNVLRQLDNGNQGFVLDYSLTYPDTTPDQRQQIMAYYAKGTLPVLDELAQNFTVCDHWFSSVPGPTWANRFFVHSGTSKGRVRMPGTDGDYSPALFLGYDQDTIYDRLNDRGVTWRIYYGDVPQSLVLTHQLTKENADNYHRMSVFFDDAAGAEPSFPAYAFIEPSYWWPVQNDDHPPHSTVKAQALLGEVYNALRKNEALWASTLLVVLYDEHGGFFDHVPPPAAVVPDGHTEEYSFDRLGVRVPAVLVSSWIDKAMVNTPFDHTSLLKFVIEQWGLAPLTQRVTQANSIGPLIRMTGPRQDTPQTVPVPPAQLVSAVQVGRAEPPNVNQEALIAFTERLESLIVEPAGKPVRQAAMKADLQTRVMVAKERVELFLQQQKARAAKARS